MSYSIEEITALIGAHRLGTSNASIDCMLTDSRSLAFPETTLFFALRTARGDGHHYIADLYRRGVRNFVVTDVPQNRATTMPDANFLKVISPLKALQRLAERHREEFSIPIVGITGSNGKTMVKEWLYQLLSPSFVVTRSPRSYNSQIGVPLSVLLLNEHTQIGLFEAGISEPGEMEALRDIIQPTIGIMTGLGTAHQENFKSMEEKCAEKLQLFQDAELVIYCADDATIERCVAERLMGRNTLAWSTTRTDVPLFISSVSKGEDGTSISYSYLGFEGQFVIPFTDDASIPNAIHCLAMLLYLHVPADEIARRMAQLEPVAMRLEVKEGRHGCTLINDSYNSDVHSLSIALDFMSRRPDRKGRSRTLILSDIDQSGMPPQQLYAEVAQQLRGHDIHCLIGVGPDITAAAELFDVPEKYFFGDTDALIDSDVLAHLTDQVVLIKGARRFGFERVSDLLALKVHETTLEVNLGAVVENLNHYRSFLRSPEVKMVCMVKASAYGAGAIEVSKTLQDHGVDYLAVAVADEGADLRRAGITSNIIIMNPEMTAFETMFAHRLEPEVYNFRLLDALIHAARRDGITGFPIHIKLDTGMHRLGFNPETDLERLIDRLSHQTAVVPRSVFSHFVGSDSADFDDFSARQFAIFDRASRRLQQAFPHRILRHICNSAGIERFPDRQLDMVRLGIGLYGIDPCTNTTLSNVCSLRTTILQIRTVPATDTVGYSRKGHLSRTSRIGAIPIGYADGLNRHLGCGKGYCLVHGHKAPYVGNICMDVAMIDLTDIPEAREGDRVEIFGDRLPVTVLSDALDTIPYEVLTSVSTRVKRIYFQD